MIKYKFTAVLNLNADILFSNYPLHCVSACLISDDQVIKFIDDTDDDIESKEGDKLLEDSDEKYSSFASIPNGSVKQNGEVTSNDYVSESSPMLSSHDTPETTEVSEEATKDNESEDADLEASPLLEKPEAEASQPGTSS